MRSAWLWSLIVLLGLAAGSYLVFRASQSPPLPEGILYGNGHIEATEVRVASEVAGRVLRHDLEEGSRVERGEVVVVIDPQSSRDQLRVIQGEIAALQQSKAALSSQISLWEHHVGSARRRLDRVRELLRSDLASERDRETTEDALREAEAQLATLRAQRAALEDQITSAEARVHLAERRLQKTEVPAPRDGVVLVRAVETGELVEVGQPLALIADLDRLELKIYLSGEDIGKVALGNPARVEIDAFTDRYFPARIIRIDDYAQFTPREIHLPQERTRLVYGVTLALENAGGQLKPGMPADAWVRWREASPWPDELRVPEG